MSSDIEDAPAELPSWQDMVITPTPLSLPLAQSQEGKEIEEAWIALQRQELNLLEWFERRQAFLDDMVNDSIDRANRNLGLAADRDDRREEELEQMRMEVSNAMVAVKAANYKVEKVQSRVDSVEALNASLLERLKELQKEKNHVYDQLLLVQTTTDSTLSDVRLLVDWVHSCTARLQISEAERLRLQNELEQGLLPHDQSIISNLNSEITTLKQLLFESQNKESENNVIYETTQDVAVLRAQLVELRRDAGRIAADLRIERIAKQRRETRVEELTLELNLAKQCLVAVQERLSAAEAKAEVEATEFMDKITSLERELVQMRLKHMDDSVRHAKELQDAVDECHEKNLALKRIQSEARNDVKDKDNHNATSEKESNLVLEINNLMDKLSQSETDLIKMVKCREDDSRRYSMELRRFQDEARATEMERELQHLQDKAKIAELEKELMSDEVGNDAEVTTVQHHNSDFSHVLPKNFLDPAEWNTLVSMNQLARDDVRRVTVAIFGWLASTSRSRSSSDNNMNIEEMTRIKTRHVFLGRQCDYGACMILMALSQAHKRTNFVRAFFCWRSSVRTRMVHPTATAVADVKNDVDDITTLSDMLQQAAMKLENHHSSLVSLQISERSISRILSQKLSTSVSADTLGRMQEICDSVSRRVSLLESSGRVVSNSLLVEITRLKDTLALESGKYSNLLQEFNELKKRYDRQMIEMASQASNYISQPVKIDSLSHGVDEWALSQQSLESVESKVLIARIKELTDKNIVLMNCISKLEDSAFQVAPQSGDKTVSLDESDDQLNALRSRFRHTTSVMVDRFTNELEECRRTYSDKLEKLTALFDGERKRYKQLLDEALRHHSSVNVASSGHHGPSQVSVDSHNFQKISNAVSSEGEVRMILNNILQKKYPPAESTTVAPNDRRQTLAQRRRRLREKRLGIGSPTLNSTSDGTTLPGGLGSMIHSGRRADGRVLPTMQEEKNNESDDPDSYLASSGTESMMSPQTSEQGFELKNRLNSVLPSTLVDSEVESKVVETTVSTSNTELSSGWQDSNPAANRSYSIGAISTHLHLQENRNHELLLDNKISESQSINATETLEIDSRNEGGDEINRHDSNQVDEIPHSDPVASSVISLDDGPSSPVGIYETSHPSVYIKENIDVSHKSNDSNDSVVAEITHSIPASSSSVSHHETPHPSVNLDVSYKSIDSTTTTDTDEVVVSQSVPSENPRGSLTSTSVLPDSGTALHSFVHLDNGDNIGSKQLCRRCLSLFDDQTNKTDSCRFHRETTRREKALFCQTCNAWVDAWNCCNGCFHCCNPCDAKPHYVGKRISWLSAIRRVMTFRRFGVDCKQCGKLFVESFNHKAACHIHVSGRTTAPKWCRNCKQDKRRFECCGGCSICSVPCSMTQHLPAFKVVVTSTGRVMKVPC